MADARSAHAAALLPSGKVLVAGPTASTELYDPATNAWSPGPPMLEERIEFTLTALPNGKISSQFVVQIDSAGRQLAAYVVNGKKVVCLDVDADQPRWVATAKDDAGAIVVGTPHSAGDGRWLITELGGRVVILNAESGLPTFTREVGLPGAVPETAGVPIGDNRVLVPLSDGSAAIVNIAPEAKKE